MLEFPKWKVWLVSLVVALGVLLSMPSLLAATPYASAWPKWLPQYKINLGLDLAGGSHLLLEADANDALKQRLAAKEDEVATEFRRDPRIEIGDISTAGGRLSFMVRDPRQVDAAVERMRALSKPLALTGVRDWDVQVVEFDPRGAHSDAAGNGKGAEGCDERRARRGPPPDRPGRHEGNHGRDRG